MLTQLASASIVTLARTLTGVRAIWLVGAPQATPTVYFANHRSHGDFVLLWTSLPPDLRSLTRPVAAADYWLASPTRRFIGCEVFRAVLIDRTGAGDRSDPITQMAAALDAGRFTDPLSRRNPQRIRRSIASVQERTISPGAPVPACAARTGVDQQRSSRAAERCDRAAAARVLGNFRRCASARRRRVAPTQSRPFSPKPALRCWRYVPNTTAKPKPCSLVHFI